MQSLNSASCVIGYLNANGCGNLMGCVCPTLPCRLAMGQNIIAKLLKHWRCFLLGVSMARVYGYLPRHSFYWLLVAVALAIVPHLLHATWWMRGLALAVLLYRYRLHVGQGRMPNRSLRLLFLLAVLFGLWQQHGTLFGVEPSTQLLVAAFLLKTLEMFQRRDAYVLLVLGYFVTATLFLFYQGPFAALYALVTLWAFSAALIGINQPLQQAPAWQHGRVSASLMLQSLPMMLLLFFLVPRLGPLWAIPSPTGPAVPGMSDSLSLGA